MLVTGGASGIARASRGAEAGDRVLVVDVHDVEGRRVADEVGGAYFHADVGISPRSPRPSTATTRRPNTR